MKTYEKPKPKAPWRWYEVEVEFRDETGVADSVRAASPLEAFEKVLRKSRAKVEDVASASVEDIGPKYGGDFYRWDGEKFEKGGAR
jgi:hypothetical protein